MKQLLTALAIAEWEDGAWYVTNCVGDIQGSGLTITVLSPRLIFNVS